MPKLIDKLRSGDGLVAPHYLQVDRVKSWSRLAALVHASVMDPALPVYEIDQVSDHYFGCPKEFWDLTRDFGNLVPPRELFWMEHGLPKEIHSSEKGTTDMGFLPEVHVGVLVRRQARADVAGVEIPSEVTHVVWFELFFDYGILPMVTGPHGSIFVAADKDGRLVGAPWMQTYAGKEDEEMLRHHITFIHPFLLAIGLLHRPDVCVLDGKLVVPAAVLEARV